LLQHVGISDRIVFVYLFLLALENFGGLVRLFKLVLVVLAGERVGESVFLVQPVYRFAVFNCRVMVLVRGPFPKENILGLSLGEALLKLGC